MNYTFEIIVDGQTQRKWDQVIANFSDANIYQSWAYGSVHWGEKNLSHMILRRGQDILAAAQLRIVQVPFISAGIAYLRWGPMFQNVNESLQPTIMKHMINSLKREYSIRRKLCLQIIPYVYTGQSKGRMLKHIFASEGIVANEFSHPYRTIIVDLNVTTEELRKKLHQKWRNQLNRSEKNGLEFEVSKKLSAYHEFLRIYQEMMARKQFYTTVDAKKIWRMQDYLSDRFKMHVFLARKDENVVAALVESHIGDTAIYLLGATSQEGRDLKAAYFLQWQAMMFNRDRGAHYYDLGGIDPDNNPGGYLFKSRFGGDDVTQLPSHFCHGGLLSRAIYNALNAWRRT